MRLILTSQYGVRNELVISEAGDIVSDEDNLALDELIEQAEETRHGGVPGWAPPTRFLQEWADTHDSRLEIEDQFPWIELPEGAVG